MIAQNEAALLGGNQPAATNGVIQQPHDSTSGENGQGFSPFCPQFPNLLKTHYAHLVASGISDEVIAERCYYSALGKKQLEDLGFSKSQCRTPALVLPIHTTDGGTAGAVIRPDNPRIGERGRPRKYEIAANAGLRLDCPPRCQPMLANPSIPLWVTEGQKKADALATHGLCAIALLGVWNFKGKNEFGGTTFLVDWDYIALKGRTVNIVFDSDVTTIPEVQQALTRLKGHLQ